MTTLEYIEAFDKYRMYIFYFCKKWLGSQEDAEDITADVFIKLWEHRESVFLESAKPFLLVAANHKCQDHLRRIKKYKEIIDSLPANELEEIEIESAVIGYIYGMMDAMGAQEKKIFLLKHKDGIKVKEISRRLNLSPQTVSNTLHTGMNKLKKAIKNRGIGPG